MWRVNNMGTREKTNKLLELIENDMISAEDVVMMCLKWMSEDDVAEMLQANEVDIDEEDY
jgi:hypothetical protein